MLYLYLAVGGAIGTLARFAIGGWVQPAGSGFPWGTFVVNISGSLFLGFLIRSADVLPLGPDLRALLTIGFCGAFTTFSTFSVETVTLIQNGEWPRAAAYSLGSLAAGLVAVLIGFQAAAPLIRNVG